MTSDFWGRVFFTGFLVMILGAVIIGLSQEHETIDGSKTGEEVGAVIAFFGAVGTFVATCAYMG